MACNSKKLNIVSIRNLIKMMRSRKYVVYNEPYKLNIVGIRKANTEPTKFDDTINVFFKNDNNTWEGYQYKATTDPSTKYLITGGIGTYEGKKATAILPNGQYVDKWKIGSHRGQYSALTQSKELCVYRDYDRDELLTFNVDDKNCGLFGINIHRAKTNGADDGEGNTETIGSYSAGCQVFQNYYCFQEFMEMCNKQRELYGNSFTYTLFDLSLKRKFLLRRVLIGATILSALGFIGYGLYLYNNKK